VAAIRADAAGRSRRGNGTSSGCTRTQADLDTIACKLNTRPRKRLGFRTPEECNARSLESLKRAVCCDLDLNSGNTSPGRQSETSQSDPVARRQATTRDESVNHHDGALRQSSDFVRSASDEYSA